MAQIEVKVKLDLPAGVELLGYEPGAMPTLAWACRVLVASAVTADYP